MCGGATTRKWCAGPRPATRVSTRSRRRRSVSASRPCGASTRGGRPCSRSRTWRAGSVIGKADYRDLDPYAGVATLGVTIGEREFWGRGHGSDALRLLVDHPSAPTTRSPA
ncbi:GNAT family N-acetyltransferase, partial [Streptomyces sp. SID7760]|nr:GNAT family N-acetyltransferase [Streptomyces sp. SID7760]